MWHNSCERKQAGQPQQAPGSVHPTVTNTSALHPQQRSNIQFERDTVILAKWMRDIGSLPPIQYTLCVSPFLHHQLAVESESEALQG